MKWYVRSPLPEVGGAFIGAAIAYRVNGHFDAAIAAWVFTIIIILGGRLLAGQSIWEW